MCAWTAPKTFTVGSVLTAAELNIHVRDNLNFLRTLNRQGATSSGIWEGAGTNNYVETNVFIQAGCVAVSITTAQSFSTSTVTLPVSLSYSRSALAFVSIVGSAIFHNPSIQVSAINQIQVGLNQKAQDSSSYVSAVNVPVNWLVIGK